ncbi:MAG TPA: XRE family transcriptional regulator [Caulobacteraceae bacterium]|nr:XRE family transcriptional regulator [Caulobacteraceae bacterium]
MRKYEALPPSLPPRGLCREAAARYVGVSPTKFDEMVDDGRMPTPKRVDARKIWDRSALDFAFDALPQEEEANPWDALLASKPVFETPGRIGDA